MKGVPNKRKKGTSLILTGTVEPKNATYKTIEWKISDAGNTGASLNGNSLSAASSGTVTVRAVITDGKVQGTDYIQDFTITVKRASSEFVPVKNIKNIPTEAVEGAVTILIGTVEPRNATNKDIIWRLDNEPDANLSGDKLYVHSTEDVIVAAKIPGGTESGDYEQRFIIHAKAFAHSFEIDPGNFNPDATNNEEDITHYFNPNDDWFQDVDWWYYIPGIPSYIPDGNAIPLFQRFQSSAKDNFSKKERQPLLTEND